MLYVVRFAMQAEEREVRFYARELGAAALTCLTDKSAWWAPDSASAQAGALRLAQELLELPAVTDVTVHCLADSSPGAPEIWVSRWAKPAKPPKEPKS